MRASLKLLLASAAAMAMLAPSYAAVSVKIEPVADAASMRVFGINDQNMIVGGYTIKGDGEHAFRGPINGKYISFDLGKEGSEARGINNAGYITGISRTDKNDFARQPIYERLPTGKIFQVRHKGDPLFGIAQGISNSQNKFAGSYWGKETADFRAYGFLGVDGHWKSHVYVSTLNIALAAYGINASGMIVGEYAEPPSQYGFIRNGKKWSQVSYPSKKSAGTELVSVNDKGKAVGHWFERDGTEHSFVLDIAANTFTDIHIKGANRVDAWSINSAGAVVVNTDTGPFVWCENQKACPTGKAVYVNAPVHFVPTGSGKHSS